MQHEKHHLWSEQYRPRKVADCILPDRIRLPFDKIVKGGTIPSMTLVGPPGSGKTSLARALCEEMGVDYIIINASKEGNIDTIRTRVQQFATTVSLRTDGGFKCIILDEADGLSMASQNALRGFIEEVSRNCTFIFTGNYGNRISDAIKSRAPVVDFSVTREERRDLIVRFIRAARAVLASEGVKHSPEELTSVIVAHFPDYRKTWNLLQRFSSTGELLITSQVGINDDALKELHALLKGKEFSKMRKWVVDHLDNDGAMLRRAIYDKLSQEAAPSSIPQLVLILAEYDYKEAHVMDIEINTVAMLTSIMAEVTWK